MKFHDDNQNNTQYVRISDMNKTMLEFLFQNKSHYKIHGLFCFAHLQTCYNGRWTKQNIHCNVWKPDCLSRNIISSNIRFHESSHVHDEIRLAEWEYIDICPFFCRKRRTKNPRFTRWYWCIYQGNISLLIYCIHVRIPISVNFKYVTWSREMSNLSKNFNFNFLTPLSQFLKMLQFDANPITIGYLVTELWRIWQC